MLTPVDVTPLSADPVTIPDPVRRSAHRTRYDAQHAADRAHTALLDALTESGIPADRASALVDDLIMATRTADAYRLEHARTKIHDYENHRHWGGISDVNEAVDFLHATTHAFPVRRPETGATQTQEHP